jgi:2-dehydro-3-deoxygluconokinase
MKKVVGFGEVMLRMSPPGYQRFLQAQSFDINYTGAEANVCVSLSRLGFETELVTKLPPNAISECAVATLRKFGVGVSRVAYGGERLGSYYLERGASQRPSKIIYDRKYSSISQATRGDFDWDAILKDAALLHVSGITPALGENLPAICRDAFETARRYGVQVSCDLNYRKNLWTPERAKSVMSGLAGMTDILIGNEEDAEMVLGIAPKHSDVVAGKLEPSDYEEVASEIVSAYGCKTVAFTMRTSLSASDNLWKGMLFQDGTAYFSKEYNMHIVDRVGGGDSFSAGLICAILRGDSPSQALDFAVAASCLKHATELDFNLSSVEEVTALMNGDGSGRVQR